MQRDRSGAWIGAAFVVAGLLHAPAAFAQRRMQGSATPSAPITPYDFVAPSPAQIVPPYPYLYGPNGEPFPDNQPPFDRPLPPSIQLPPPIRIPGAMPPPVPDVVKTPIDVMRTVPALPGQPPPLRLPERPDEAQAPAGAVRQSLSELDRRLGLGSVGPVVSAARDVAQSEWVTGSAQIEVIADRTGRIQSVRVVQVSQDPDGWRRYAEELRGAQRSGMRLPETARGLWTLLELRAGNELSSGHQRWWAPGVFVFDIADVNAHRMRTVHTKVLSEVWF